MNTYRRRILGFILSSLMISSIQAAGREASGPVVVAFRRGTPPALALALSEGPHLALARSPSFEALSTERKRRERSASQEFMNRWYPQLQTIANGFFALAAETDESKIREKAAQLTTRAALLKKALKDARDKIVDDLYVSLLLELQGIIPDERWPQRMEEAEWLLKHAEDLAVEHVGYGIALWRDPEWRKEKQEQLSAFKTNIAASSSLEDLARIEDSIEKAYFYTLEKPESAKDATTAVSAVVAAAASFWTWKPQYLILGNYCLEIGDLYVALETKRNQLWEAKGRALTSPTRHSALADADTE